MLIPARTLSVIYPCVHKGQRLMFFGSTVEKLLTPSQHFPFGGMPSAPGNDCIPTLMMRYCLGRWPPGALVNIIGRRANSAGLLHFAHITVFICAFTSQQNVTQKFNLEFSTVISKNCSNPLDSSPFWGCLGTR